MSYFINILSPAIILIFTGVIPYLVIILAFKNFGKQELKSRVLFVLSYAYFYITTSVISCLVTVMTLTMLSYTIFMNQSFLPTSESTGMVMCFITAIMYLVYAFKYSILKGRFYNRYMTKMSDRTSEKFVAEFLSIEANRRSGYGDPHMGVGLYLALYKTLCIHIPIYTVFIIIGILIDI